MNDITIRIYLARGLLLTVLTAVAGIWLLLQALLWTLSHDIKRVLVVRGQTAYEYLQNGRFWKTKSGRYVWFLKGPGMYKLARKVLVLARQEIKEQNLRSNIILYTQCSSCIFLRNCGQKYDIRCRHCAYVRECPYHRIKKSDRMCGVFRCARWIEMD